MDREYDLFEHMLDGSLQWRGFEKGLEDARQRLRILHLETGNDCFAIDISTNEVVASTQWGKSEGRLKNLCRLRSEDARRVH